MYKARFQEDKSRLISSKLKPPLLQQVDVELFEMMPKSQILQVKREITFSNNNKLPNNSGSHNTS